MRPSHLVSGLVLAISASAGAQGTLASRVAQVRDGTIRMEYDARAGVCGDGRETVAFRNAYFASNMQSWGTWHDKRCAPGNIRVTLNVSGGDINRVRTQVGGSWPSTDGRMTDLGSVSSREAAALFFSLVPKLETESGKSRVLLPAVLADADDAAVIAPLTRLARDTDRTMETRRDATHWLGLLGDKSVVPTLVSIAKQGGDYDGEKKSLRSSATYALALVEDGAGVASLLDLSRDGSASMRKATIFALAETDDPRAFRRLKQMLDDKDETREIRKDALFWLGQRSSSSTADIVSFYRANDDAALREQAIFVLSQRDDDASVDALIKIAKDGDDKRMRSKALFWLAQKKDPRVIKLLSDILSR